jgi:signal transduction histidine kinase
VSLLGFDAAAVLLLDADRKSLRLFHAVGLPEAVTSRLERVPASAVVWARALIERRVVVLQTGSHPDEDASGVRPGLAAHGLGLVVSVPLLAFNDVHGVLTLASRRPLEPSAATLDLLASIGTQIAGALVHARQLEQRAHQERLAALGRLAAGIAHELKNPLAVIDARLQLLRRESDALGGPAARHLASLEEASEWMKRIMHGLSTYAKPARSEPQLLDARELLSATRELVAYDARKAGVTVEVEIQGEPPAVLADRSEMMQVLVNLATNAIQAMEPGGGRLTLRAAAAQDAAGRTATVIEVSDTGPRIPEDRRERIWEPFYTTKPDGTGLGLSIVRALVAKQPAAWIDMETRAGVGTTFRITLHASP